MRRLVSLLVGTGLLLTVAAAPVAAGGPPTPDAFYADGTLYRTIATPASFVGTGAPDSSFEPIYALGPGLTNVAEAAPGQPGFKGGRWIVLPVIWHVPAVQLTRSSEVHALLADGSIELGPEVTRFECPIIPAPHHSR